MEIYIAETVAKRRRELGLTQEELASRLGVSAQAVSNWERNESYPDVTMLPVLSSALGISVDELLGVGRESVGAILVKWYDERGKYKEDPEKLKASVLRLSREYPKCYALFDTLCWWIYRRAKDDPVMRRTAIDMSKRILAECTDSGTRQSAVTILALLSDDDEAQQYIDHFGMWISIQPNIIARRAQDRGETEKARAYFELEHLWVFLYMCGWLSYCREDPAQSVRYYALRESFVKAVGGGSVPEGLLWQWFTLKLFHSAALFALGEKDAGYEALTEGVEAYERWGAFDKGQPLSIGELSPSGSITVRRDCICDDPTNAIYIGNELFSIRHGGVSVRHSVDLIRKMFAPVLEEERFRELFGRAVKVEERATAS